MINIAKIFLLLNCIYLSGCLGNIMTGAGVLYDRHHLYKQVNDISINTKVGNALYKDSLLRCKTCSIDYTTFNGDILIAGSVPTEALKEEAYKRIAKLSSYRRLFFQLKVKSSVSNYLQDSIITAKIRSRILADSDINPKSFKVVTSDEVVYLMGDVLENQAQKVTLIAQETDKVLKVVRLFKYYQLT